MELSAAYKGARRRVAALMLAGVFTLSACGGTRAAADLNGSAEAADAAQVPAERAQALAAAIRLPEAPGTVVCGAYGVSCDLSNTSLGYIMARAENDKRMKLRLVTEAGTYTYELPTDGTYATYPLQMGDGDYTLTVYENAGGDRYASVYKTTFSVQLQDEMLPYLYPNQYVDYTAEDLSVLKSFLLAEADKAASAKVKKLYQFVANNIAYDYDKAATVEAGYLPDPDETLETGKGICFDYSALLATMLRVQGIPTRLVIGYVAPEGLYHAWNTAYFDGEWVLYDATLAREKRNVKNYAEERVY